MKLEECDSTGPGPGMLITDGGSRVGAKGARTKRECGLSAGLSTRALPTAPLMNVY